MLAYMKGENFKNHEFFCTDSNMNLKCYLKRIDIESSQSINIGDIYYLTR